jgi:YVTN family beta-propeller protein
MACLVALAACGGGGGDGASPAPVPPPPPPPPVSDVPQDPLAIGHPTFLSPHASPIAVSDGRVLVVNTPNDTLDVIDVASLAVVASVDVGIDPVGIALRPDGREAWVANHVSDSVSVVDIDPLSTTYLQVVATVQDLDPVTKATRFDEPVGIAFASDAKAYVALSSENTVAIVDVATRQVTNRLSITAQDPRALTVRNGRLYVIPFESNNQTQISGCVDKIDGDLCTFDAVEHVITNNNVLSLNAVVDIVKNPRVPDRDLYVFDTATDQLVDVVDTLGTLLYGIAVDSTGRVFVAQTDARNDVNGRAGTLQHGLAEMENRAFLNQITRVDCGGAVCGTPGFIDLEPVPPAQPAPGTALATPFAIEVSDDDATLIVTAAGSNKVFTVDAATGTVLGRVDVDAAPRGVALVSSEDNTAQWAWVFNAVANTVSLVDVSDPANPTLTATVTLEDPTHPVVKAGRIAFNDAGASTTGTFSCESCHPDGGTDQLLWVLDTPFCSLAVCNQVPPRITMPIRGLRDTAPFHWDGIPGDPYGGINTANVRGNDPPNCSLDRPESCTRFLVDGSLATTLCEVRNCPSNNEGKAGALSAAERDAMATFLLSVPYPPAQRRAYDNVLSDRARDGFRLFHIDGDLQGDPEPNVCGDCHRMPFWVSTNTPGTGMDAPTWRGAYDRWLILPQGRLNIIDFDFYRNITALGTPEENMWRFSWASRTRFNPVWNMVIEGSTGFSGAFGRQLTLNQQMAGSTATRDLLGALEQAAGEGAIVLQAEGVLIDDAGVTPLALQFDAPFESGAYVERAGDRGSFTRDELLALAGSGELIATFTGRTGTNIDVDNPQPALWTAGAIETQSGRQQFPMLNAGNTTMKIRGRHIREGAGVFVDGRKVVGTVGCETGELPACGGESIEVWLETLPAAGMHFLQVQNTDGLFSNDFIFHAQ